MKTLSPRPLVHETAQVTDSRLGEYTEVGPRTKVVETTMGDYSYVVNDSSIIYATIGKFCSIAAQTRLNPGNHPMWRATQHHFTYRSRQYGLGEDDESFFDWRREHPVSLGHDVWIGHGAIILPGVSVASGAVVGAGAVVSKDVCAYTVVAGVPARPIRDRLEERLKEAFLALAWWDWPRRKLAEALPDFRALDAAGFLAKYA